MSRRGIFCTENGAALFTRMQVVEDVTGSTLQQVVDETVAPGSKIECDGYRFNRRKTGDRSSCAWQEPSPHLALCCVKPISKFQNMTTSAQRQKTPRDPTSGIAGVRGEDLRFRPLAGALGGVPGGRPGKRAPTWRGKPRRIWRRRRKKRKGLKRAAVWPHYGFACVKRFCCSSARSRMPRVRQKSGFLRSQPSICVIWARRSSSVERCR